MSRLPESLLSRPILGLVVGVCVVNAAASAYYGLRLYRTTGHPGFAVAGKGEAVTVGQIRPEGPAASLRTGDLVLALDGRGVRGPESVLHFFSRRPPGPYELTIRREGRVERLRLEAPPLRWGFTLSLGLARFGVHLLFALSGLALYLLRPETKAGLLLTLAFSLFAPGDHLAYATDGLPAPMRLLYLACDWMSIFFWPALLHFFLVFPEPSPLVRRLPALERLLYVPSLGLALGALPIRALQYWDPERAWVVAREAGSFAWLAEGIWLASSVLGLVVLWTSYSRATDASRGRLRVAVLGALLGLSPLLVLLGTGAFVDVQRLPLEVTRALVLVSLAALPVVPLAFGYAILRHDLIPLRVLVRRGLRYLLVSRGVVVVEALLVAFLVVFTLSGSRGRFVDSLGPRADIAVAVGVGALGLVVVHRLNRRLRAALDRRFFREAYDARRVLASLSEAVREVPHADALVNLVAQRMKEALHPEAVRLFRRDEETGRFRLAYPRSPAEPEFAPPDLVERLSGMDHAVAFDSALPGPGGTVLALAMRGRRELQGVLCLGPRLGDLPYTREDRELLRSVASQAGLSLENGGLMRRLARQERMAHELQIAAEVQRRLFPDRAPPARGLDLAGICVPAGDVGGDYYDFLELADGRVGIAVADVAGKGLPAALLMSMVQASLRSQAAGERSLAKTCDGMNRLLYRSTAPNAYATFFYAAFEEGGRRLRYVNAGHNPPLVVREAPPGPGVPLGLGGSAAGAAAAVPAPQAALAEGLKLRATGLVLGALAESPYEEEVLDLAEGDVLVAYTDGVSEAFGPRGEEFGEGRLLETVAMARGQPAAGVVDRVARAVDAWRGNAPAHDDFTLVVARIV